ncbi:Hsp70 family protein [Dactylosporangium sp. CA-139066]|uniref:Hsp70 family protein n=1 Tax=Dactylosporangium sp. CA-139066 TaxID=3239930 RepID=UPI003D8F07F7
MLHRLAIDYGSSHTVAALRRPGDPVRPLLFDGTPLLSSAVFADADGTILTGADALAGARIDPARFEPSPKRQIDAGEVLLGDGPVPVAALIAATLRRVADEAARVNGGEPFETVLTHPAGWGAARRAVLRSAAEAAGLARPEMLAEPVAAALQVLAGAGPAEARGRPLAVFDLGGGTFDVAVVRADGDGFEILAADGLADVGGADLDALVVDIVRRAAAPADPEAWARLTAPGTRAERRAFRAFWDAARAAREHLSRHSSATLVVPLLDRDVPVTREQFEQAAAPVLGLAVDRTLAVLRRARLDPGDLAGILLVGGATRTPLVGTLLHRATGRPPIVREQPELIVAEGALGHATAAPAAREAPQATPQEPAVVPPEPGPRRERRPMRSHGSRARPLAEFIVAAVAIVAGLAYVAAHDAMLDDLPTGGWVWGIAVLVGTFMVAVSGLFRTFVPDLLVIDDHGVHHQRMRWGRGLQRHSVPWTEIREAVVTDVDLFPNLVLRTHAGPRDGEALTSRRYAPQVAGYPICRLGEVGADADRVRAAIAEHAPPARP